jgi:hypothetical protein
MEDRVMKSVASKRWIVAHSLVSMLSVPAKGLRPTQRSKL